MKAKYRYFGNDCIIYYQIICVDNIFVSVTLYQSSWSNTPPNAEVKVCLTNAEARRMYFNACVEFEKRNYECVYREKI